MFDRSLKSVCAAHKYHSSNTVYGVPKQPTTLISYFEDFQKISYTCSVQFAYLSNNYNGILPKLLFYILKLIFCEYSVTLSTFKRVGTMIAVGFVRELRFELIHLYNDFVIKLSSEKDCRV